MTARRFKMQAYLDALGLTVATGAAAIGRSHDQMRNYVSGHLRGKQKKREPVEVPLVVRLACAAVALGVEDFDGETVVITPRPFPKSEHD